MEGQLHESTDQDAYGTGGIGAGSCVEGARVVRLLQPVLPHPPEDGLAEMEVAPVDRGRGEHLGGEGGQPRTFDRFSLVYILYPSVIMIS